VPHAEGEQTGDQTPQRVDQEHRHDREGLCKRAGKMPEQQRGEDPAEHDRARGVDEAGEHQGQDRAGCAGEAHRRDPDQRDRGGEQETGCGAEIVPGLLDDDARERAGKGDQAEAQDEDGADVRQIHASMLAPGPRPEHQPGGADGVRRQATADCVRGRRCVGGGAPRCCGS